MDVIANDMRILLVDDDPFMLTLLQTLLRQLGHTEVRAVDSAIEALRMLDEEFAEPDLIVCDLNMPDIDGIELLRQLRTRSFRGAVAITTGEDERVLQTALKLLRVQGLQSAGSLPKPITRDGVQGILAEVEKLRSTRPRRRPERVYGPADLKAALDGHQFFNVYQPQVRIDDFRFVGVEALVRWSHPEHGTVFPDQFIPIVEEHGLIHQLTWEVTRAALRDLRTLREAGLDLRVSINVSMDDLDDLTLPDKLVSLAQDAGVPLRHVVLEITESRLMHDPASTLDILARLRLKHVRLSIDDFGTGHSSLAQLRDIPFDELKIDKGFVQGATTSATNRAIVEASLGMAQRLSVETVAEGVETRADWDFLRERGCDVVQGYLVARPMPATELLAFDQAWRVRSVAEFRVGGTN